MNLISQRPPRALSRGPGDPNDDELVATLVRFHPHRLLSAKIAGPAATIAGPSSAGAGTYAALIGIGAFVGLAGGLLFFTTSAGPSLTAIAVGTLGGAGVGYLMANDLSSWSSA